MKFSSNNSQELYTCPACQIIKKNKNVPHLKKVTAKKNYICTLCKTKYLIKSGIPIIDALDVGAAIVGNANYRSIIIKAKEDIKSGRTISESFSGYKEIPALFTSMMSIGERSGKISGMLEHLAKFYKSESENSIQNITQLIEPVMILVLGTAVGVLISSILLPLYSLVGSI